MSEELNLLGLVGEDDVSKVASFAKSKFGKSSKPARWVAIGAVFAVSLTASFVATYAIIKHHKK